MSTGNIDLLLCATAQGSTKSRLPATSLHLTDHIMTIKFFLPVAIVIIPDVLVTNLITKLYESRLAAIASHTMLAGMKFSITGTPNSHDM